MAQQAEGAGAAAPLLTTPLAQLPREEVSDHDHKYTGYRMGKD